MSLNNCVYVCLCGLFHLLVQQDHVKELKYTNPQINYLITMPRVSTCPLPLYMLFCGFIWNIFFSKVYYYGFSVFCHLLRLFKVHPCVKMK